MKTDYFVYSNDFIVTDIKKKGKSCLCNAKTSIKQLTEWFNATGTFQFVTCV